MTGARQSGGTVGPQVPGYLGTSKLPFIPLSLVIEVVECRGDSHCRVSIGSSEGQSFRRESRMTVSLLSIRACKEVNAKAGLL